MRTRRTFLKQCAAGTLAASLPLAPPAGSFEIKAGAAKRRVTPPLAVPYLTSSSNGTNAPFKAVHDDLFVKALILDDGANALAVLAVDSIGYDNAILGPRRNFTAELRQRVAARTKLRPEAIMLSATHAHSTPETIGLTPFAETKGATAWLEQHLEDLVETAVSAWKDRQPARVHFRQRGVEGIARHRRRVHFRQRGVEGIARHRRILLKSGKLSRHGPLPLPGEVLAPWEMDEELSILHFQRPDGSALATLLNYTAHPVVAMLLPEVCADFPGAATALMEESLPGSICLFTNGAAGNINTLHVSSSYEDVDRLGRRLAEAALAEVKNFRVSVPMARPRLKFASSHVQLIPRSTLSLAEAEEAMWNERTVASERAFRLAKKLREDSLRAPVQMMSVGPVKWISLPGEAFVETGLALKKAGASFVVGYANGWHGYFPIDRAYSEGGYEVELGAWSRVAPGSAEALQSAGETLLASSF